MTPHPETEYLAELTARLKGVGLPCTDEAAYYIGLVTPLWPMIVPMLAATVRQRIHERQLAAKDHEAKELADALAELISLDDPPVAAKVRALGILTRWESRHG